MLQSSAKRPSGHAASSVFLGIDLNCDPDCYWENLIDINNNFDNSDDILNSNVHVFTDILLTSYISMLVKELLVSKLICSS